MNLFKKAMLAVAAIFVSTSDTVESKNLRAPAAPKETDPDTTGGGAPVTKVMDVKKPTTKQPTTLKPTTLKPTTLKPTTLKPTTLARPIFGAGNEYGVTINLQDPNAIYSLPTVATPDFLNPAINSSSTELKLGGQYRLVDIPGMSVIFNNFAEGFALSLATNTLGFTKNGLVIVDSSQPGVTKEIDVGADFKRNLQSILAGSVVKAHILNNLFFDHTTNNLGLSVVLEGANGEMLAVPIHNLPTLTNASILTKEGLVPDLKGFEPDFNSLVLNVETYDAAMNFVGVSKAVSQYDLQTKLATVIDNGRFETFLNAAKSLPSKEQDAMNVNNGTYTYYSFVEQIATNANNTNLESTIVKLKNEIEASPSLDALFSTNEYEAQAMGTPKEKELLIDYLSTLLRAADWASANSDKLQEEFYKLVNGVSEEQKTVALGAVIYLSMLDPILKAALANNSDQPLAVKLMIALDENLRTMRLLNPKIDRVKLGQETGFHAETSAPTKAPTTASTGAASTKGTGVAALVTAMAIVGQFLGMPEREEATDKRKAKP